MKKPKKPKSKNQKPKRRIIKNVNKKLIELNIKISNHINQEHFVINKK